VSGLIGSAHNKLVFGRRIRRLADCLLQALPETASVLDVGCGDGSLDCLLQQHRPGLQIEGIDVLVRPNARIPVQAFDGITIPHADRSFDIVMFVDVLHHADDALQLLKEARRVCRRGVVIKDHLVQGIAASSTLRFMDWVGNASHGVALPYLYWTPQQWQSGFAASGLGVGQWQENLALYPWPASLMFDRGLHFVARLDPR